MKKYILLIAIVSIQGLIAQEKSVIELLTSGKWFVEYIIVEEEKLEFAPELQQRTWMLFHSKGKGEFMVNGKKTTGRWEYDDISNIIKTSKGPDVVKHKIVSINDKQLVLQELGEEDSIISLRK